MEGERRRTVRDNLVESFVYSKTRGRWFDNNLVRVVGDEAKMRFGADV